MHAPLFPHQDETDTLGAVHPDALLVRDIAGMKVAETLRPGAQRGTLTTPVEYQTLGGVVRLRLPYGTRDQLISLLTSPLSEGVTLGQKALSLYIASGRSRDAWKRFAEGENADYDLVQKRGFLIPVDWRNFRRGFTDKQSPEDLLEIIDILGLSDVFHDYVTLQGLPLVTRDQLLNDLVRRYIKEGLSALSKGRGAEFHEALQMVLIEWNTQKVPKLGSKTYAEYYGWKMPSVIIRGGAVLPTHFIGILGIGTSTIQDILGALGIPEDIWESRKSRRANGPSYEVDDYIFAWENTDIGRYYIALRMIGVTGTKAYDLSLKRFNATSGKKYGYTISSTSPRAELARKILKDTMQLCQRTLTNEYQNFMRRALAKMMSLFLIRNGGPEVGESDIVYHRASETYRFSSGFLMRLSKWKMPKNITLEYLQFLLETGKTQEDDAIKNLVQLFEKKE